MFEHFLYMVALVVSIGSLSLLDWKYHLALFLDARRTIRTVASVVIIFIVWDVMGIYSGIFRVGGSPYLTGLRLAHEFPLEELFFLTLLVYIALLLMRTGEKIWPRT